MKCRWALRDDGGGGGGGGGGGVVVMVVDGGSLDRRPQAIQSQHHLLSVHFIFVFLQSRWLRLCNKRKQHFTRLQRSCCAPAYF
jgi:hypothetical protein